MFSIYIDSIASFIDSIAKEGCCRCSLQIFTKSIMCDFTYDVCTFKKQLSPEDRDELTLLLLTKPNELNKIRITKHPLEDHILNLEWELNEEYVMRKRLKLMLNDTKISLDDVYDTLIEFIK